VTDTEISQPVGVTVATVLRDLADSRALDLELAPIQARIGQSRIGQLGVQLDQLGLRPIRPPLERFELGQSLVVQVGQALDGRADQLRVQVDDAWPNLFREARFLSALARGPRDLRALGRVSICAIGPSTAERLSGGGLKPDLVMPEFRADSIGEAMAMRGRLEGERVAGAAVLLHLDRPHADAFRIELVAAPALEHRSTRSHFHAGCVDALRRSDT